MGVEASPAFRKPSHSGFLTQTAVRLAAMLELIHQLEQIIAAQVNDIRQLLIKSAAAERFGAGMAFGDVSIDAIGQWHRIAVAFLGPGVQKGRANLRPKSAVHAQPFSR